MKDIKELLELRKKAKKKKPGFVVKESNFASRVKVRWRFPRGKHSKVRQMHKGRPALPGMGYSSPRAVRGLHSSGLEFSVVHNETELKALDSKKQGAVISRTVGKRKKAGLLELAQKENITLLNVADITKLLDQLKANFENRKKLKTEKLASKNKKEEDKKKKAEEKKKKEESEKETKKEESVEKKEENKKKEAEKVITKKQ